MQRTMVAAAALVALAPVAALTITTTGGPASAGPATSAAEQAPGYFVVAKINTSEVVAGEDVVRVTGKVKPRVAGQTVILQQRLDGTQRWKKSGQARTRATGRFVLKDEPSTPGVRFYRVVKPASDGIKAGTSRELRLAVWSWERLISRRTGANNGISFDYPQFGTVYYPDSIRNTVSGTPGYVEYTLGGKARSLRASYALTDNSLTGASGTVAVTVDGTKVWSVNLGTGSIDRDRVIDVTGAFRIRFDLSSSGAPAGYAAIGTPEVLTLE
ncbi:MAG TPA: hypothetical protein VGD39_20015 [Nocardioides sp.]